MDAVSPRSAGLVVMAILLVVEAVILVDSHPVLPDRMAQHFAADGAANGWFSKRGFCALMAAVTLLVVVLVHGIALLLPRFPDRWIALPNRKDLLAPERRAATMTRLQRSLLTYGNATLLLVVWITYAIVEANLHPPPRLPESTLVALGAHLVFTLMWGVHLVRGLRKSA
jgi:uncharacterized membrane protein